MNHYIYLSSVVCLFCMLPAAAFGQALTDGFFRGAGQADFTLSYTYESGDTFWLGETKMDNPPFYQKLTRNTVSLYVAYGLTENIDINLNLPYIFVDGNGEGPSDELPPQSANNIQNAQLTLKWRPISTQTGQGTFDLVAAGAVAVPLSDYRNGALPDASTELPVLVSLGDRTTELSGALLAQYRLYTGLFASVQGGYTLKGETGDNLDVPNAAFVSGKIGYGSGHYYGDVSIASQFSMDGTDIGMGPFPTNQVDYTRLGLTGSYAIIPELSANAYFFTTLGGRNVLDSNGISIGITYKMGR